jgi:fatty acyl-CoA reductase
MAERTLRKRRNPKLPTLLIRPSIIIGAAKEPMAGWTDTISAAGGLSLVGGIGIVNWIHGDPLNVADLIPVDIVSNMIIVGTAIQANKPNLRIVHSASSHRRPLTWIDFKNYTFEYLKHQPY